MSLFSRALVFLLLFSSSVWAVSEPHLVIIRHGEGEHNINKRFNSNPDHQNYQPANLTDKGKEQAKKVAELLLTYGFDNRNIAAVYVSPLPRTQQTAKIVQDIGVFSADKVSVEPRLIEPKAGNLEGEPFAAQLKDHWVVTPEEALALNAETNDAVRARVLALYDEVALKHKEGHVLFFTHGTPAMELIDGVTRDEVRLKTGQAFMVPLQSRNSA